MMRKKLTSLLVVLGFALQGISFFFLAAPLGLSTSEADSNPVMPFAPVVFIVGVGMVFVAAVVYELLPENSDE
ncbi:MAG: hypothetical protein FVQ83_15465 [Chloroflexi bacterium]|nr:hypothetical protein [Chloroflexota bacterium]